MLQHAKQPKQPATFFQRLAERPSAMIANCLLPIRSALPTISVACM